MRVLYVNHTSRVSGAERSLLELLRLMRTDTEVILACPSGDLMRRAEAIGVATVELTPPQVSFSSGPRRLALALVGFARTGLYVRVLTRRHHIDVIHAASTRAGLLLSFCIFSRSKRVADVRDALPTGTKATWVRWALRISANLLVFNSKFTSDRFGPTWPATASVVYPIVDLGPLLDLPLPSREARRGPSILGVVGQITPWKGQDDAIRILASVRERFPDTRLRIIGSIVFSGGAYSYNNDQFMNQLRILANQLEVADAVEFAGETEDVRPMLASLDLLLVPSWEEPFGRIVAEGMAAGVPVIATSIGGPAELIQDSVSGFLRPPRSPGAWSATVVSLLSDRPLIAATAEEARKHISRQNTELGRGPSLLRLYRDLTESVEQTEVNGLYRSSQ